MIKAAGTTPHNHRHDFVSAQQSNGLAGPVGHALRAGRGIVAAHEGQEVHPAGLFQRPRTRRLAVSFAGRQGVDRACTQLLLEVFHRRRAAPGDGDFGGRFALHTFYSLQLVKTGSGHAHR